MPVADHRGQLILPGFIDTHVHCPQLDVIASFGTELLDWLNTHTFPAERRYADPRSRGRALPVFCTPWPGRMAPPVVVFPTVHKTSAQSLVRAGFPGADAFDHGQGLDESACTPDGLCDDVVQAEHDDCVDLIAQWHGKQRQAFAVTVRLPVTSTPEQLAMAGALCASHAGTYMQTHVAEPRRSAMGERVVPHRAQLPRRV